MTAFKRSAEWLAEEVWQKGFSAACQQICKEVAMDYTTHIPDIATVLLSERRERARAAATEVLAEWFQREPSQMAIELISSIILKHWTRGRK